MNAPAFWTTAGSGMAITTGGPQDEKAGRIIRRMSELETGRAIWEQHWSEIARRVLPREDEFNQWRTPGDRRQEWIFDSTAPLALERFAASMDSLNTPKNQIWHRLKPSNRDLLHDRDTMIYLDEVNQLLWDYRYSSRTNFASQASEMYMELGAFGTAVMLLEDDLGKGIRYKAMSLNQCYLDESAYGIIDTVYRKFWYTARQATQRWPGSVPAEIWGSMQSNPDKPFQFIHAVFPNTDLVYDRKDFRGMPWRSCYVSVTGQKVIDEGGFRTNPYQCPRYVTAPKETYGRSPAMTVLPDIKMINEMAKTGLRAGHLAVNPPILLADDGALQVFQMRPGSLNHGTLNDDGSPRVMPFKTGSDLAQLEAMMMPVRKTIQDAFLVTFFQMLVDKPTYMTATEVMIRAQEKGALLGPVGGRIQTEWLGPMIEREIDILFHAGQLPEMPDALIDEGGNIEIEYESPFARLAKSERGNGILRTFEAVTPLAQVDPAALKIFDIPAAARSLADIFNCPPELVKAPEVIAAEEAQAAQMQQMQTLLEAAPIAANTAKTLAETQKMAGVPAF